MDIHTESKESSGESTAWDRYKFSTCAGSLSQFHYHTSYQSLFPHTLPYLLSTILLHISALSRLLLIVAASPPSIDIMSQPKKGRFVPTQQEGGGSPGPRTQAARRAPAAADSPAERSSTSSEDRVHKAVAGQRPAMLTTRLPPPDLKAEGGRPAWALENGPLEHPSTLLNEIGWIWVKCPDIPRSATAEKWYHRFFEGCEHRMTYGNRNIPTGVNFQGEKRPPDSEVYVGSSAYPDLLKGICRADEWLSYLFNFYRYWMHTVAPKFKIFYPTKGERGIVTRFVIVLDNKPNFDTHNPNPLRDKAGSMRPMVEEFFNSYFQRWSYFEGWTWRKIIQELDDELFLSNTMPWPYAKEAELSFVKSRSKEYGFLDAAFKADKMDTFKPADMQTPWGVRLASNYPATVHSPFSSDESCLLKCMDPDKYVDEGDGIRSSRGGQGRAAAQGQATAQGQASDESESSSASDPADTFDIGGAMHDKRYFKTT